MSARSPYNTPVIDLQKLHRHLSDIVRNLRMGLLLNVPRTVPEEGPRQWATKVKEHFEASLKEFNLLVSGAILKETHTIRKALRRCHLHRQTAKFRTCEDTAPRVMEVYMQSFFEALTECARRIWLEEASCLESSYAQELPGQYLPYEAPFRSLENISNRMEGEFQSCLSSLETGLDYVVRVAYNSMIADKIAEGVALLHTSTKDAVSDVIKIMRSKTPDPGSNARTEAQRMYWADVVCFCMLLLRQKYAAAINKANEDLLRLLALKPRPSPSPDDVVLNTRVTIIFQDLYHCLKRTVEVTERSLCTILDDVYRTKRVRQDQKLQKAIVGEVRKIHTAYLCVQARDTLQALLRKSM